MKLAKALSQRIKTLRETSGLSQQQVAVRGDLSLSLVAKLEQGKKADPRASSLLALATALGVRPGELLDDLFSPEQAPAEALPALEESDNGKKDEVDKKKKGKGGKKKKK